MSVRLCETVDCDELRRPKAQPRCVGRVIKNSGACPDAEGCSKMGYCGMSGDVQGREGQVPEGCSLS